MFKINLPKHIQRLTPHFWRKPFFTAWLEALLIPMRTINDAFLSWVSARRVELTYTGQTIHLERMLNDLFDPEQRRIKIIHSTDDRQYDYFIDEDQPGDFDYFVSEAEEVEYYSFAFEAEANEIDGFRVSMPTSLSPKEDQIKGRILRYKLATINYQLLYN